MILYFSGTGNSRFAAELLADRLNDSIVDIGKKIKADEQGIFCSETPWVFVAPIYGWQLPRIFVEYLRNSVFSGNQNAYFVLTCGSDIGGAEKGVAALCEECGLQYHGCLEVVMPENYIVLFSAPTEHETSQIVEAAKPVLYQSAEMILQGRDFPKRKSSLLDQLKSSVINHAFYKIFVKADGFYVKDNCMSCSRCALLCPLNNIHVDSGKPVWEKNCTHCMACICGCPEGAVEYGKRSRGKRRYQCPPYEKDV